MPPGEAPYGIQGRQPPQQQQPPQPHPLYPSLHPLHPAPQPLNHYSSPQHLPPLQPLHVNSQAPPPLLPHPQFTNPYAGASQQFTPHLQPHQTQPSPVQYVHPAYAQQQQQRPPQFYPSNSPQQPPYPNYAAFQQPPAPVLPRTQTPASLQSPVQFVNPSYIQQTPPPRPTDHVFSTAPQPRPLSTVSPTLARPAQPQPLQSPVQQQQQQQQQPIQAQRQLPIPQGQAQTPIQPSHTFQPTQRPQPLQPVRQVQNVGQSPVVQSPHQKPFQPHSQPSVQPPVQLIVPPTTQPSTQPTTQQSTQPTTQPSTQPTVQQLAEPPAAQPMPVKPSPRPQERPLPPPQGTPKLLAKEPRRPSASASVTKSPATPQASSHVDHLSVLIHVAEDCFEKANAAARQIARSMTAEEVAEHHKLVATGLGCLDVALKSNKLWPRLEARLCLRYTSVLIEETTNITEAETTLTRGIAVCERHRFLDLKYCSQFLLMKTLFQRNQKAAFKSIDSHIADCTTYKHVPWIYAFRFLKAAFHLQAGTAADNHAIENLRKVAGIAHQRQDSAIFVLAMLLEGLAHLTTMKDDWATRVQMCIAQVSKLQLDDSVHTPQIDVLVLMLDLACSLHQKAHQLSAQKLTALQKRLEELKQSPDWPNQFGEMLLPINRMPNAQGTVSADTRAVVRPGEGVDYLVISTLGKQQAWALGYVLHGIVAHYKATTPGRSSLLWGEAIRLLDDKHLPPVQSLPEALKQTEWARELSCYAYILTGLQASTLSDWAKVKNCLEAIEKINAESEFLSLLALYLEGVFYQGSASLDKALEIWKDERFELDWNGAPKASSSRIARELSILAILNRLWIMQDPTKIDDAETSELLDLLRPICEDNPDMEIRTVYNLVLASIRTNPPLSINQVKRHIQQSLSGAQQTSNTQHLSIALNIMRCRIFENVVGEQALKSAKAGAAQAKKSGNVLWMSVAEGMLAQSYEMQGAIAEARMAHESGVRLANEAYVKTRVFD